jgi:hypothetical protein
MVEEENQVVSLQANLEGDFGNSITVIVELRGCKP